MDTTLENILRASAIDHQHGVEASSLCSRAYHNKVHRDEWAASEITFQLDQRKRSKLARDVLFYLIDNPVREYGTYHAVNGRIA